jgi:eukaryotic-like serine/threonine-protein kinase
METVKTIGRYEILEELGRGGMGTVYRAKDPNIDRIVALKTILSDVLGTDQAREFRERFQREARVAGRLAHPGIVPVFDIGEHEGVPFLVMELIHGQTLADTVRKGGRPTLDRICQIGQQIADALGYAHKQGVVHRDIKPANILMTSRETYGIERPRITDFGMVKLAGVHATITGQMLGTPAFMPPEQFTGEPVDGRADLFSLGVILYWMATGEQPFPGETVTAVSYKVVHTEPVPPRKLNPAISEGLDNVILKCLIKNPAERYQTGEELARDLAQLNSNSQIPVAQRTMASPSTITQPIPAPQAVHATAIAPAAKPASRLVLVAGLALVAVVGGYALRNTNVGTNSGGPVPSANANPQPDVLPPEPLSQPEATIAQPKPPVVAAKTEETTPEAKVAAAVPAKKPQPVVAAAAVDFDPKALNPNENSKLEIDARRMPVSAALTVEMNGKVYFTTAAGSPNREIQGLFVPPGVHEFRITAKSGELQKTSNIVSTEFRAKKKKTLKVELRVQGKTASAATLQDLPPDVQVYAMWD